MMAVMQYLLTEGPGILAAVNGLLLAAITLALMIPGEQPEKLLQKVVDVLSKISRK